MGFILEEYDEQACIRTWQEDGFLKGQQEKAVESAKNLLKMNLLTPEQIAQGIGLPVEQIIELKSQISVAG